MVYTLRYNSAVAAVDASSELLSPFAEIRRISTDQPKIFCKKIYTYLIIHYNKRIVYSDKRLKDV
jgi:hypothetical protein